MVIKYYDYKENGYYEGKSISLARGVVTHCII